MRGWIFPGLLVLLAGILAWFGLGSLSDRQAEAGTLAERMGNPSLAALLADESAMGRAQKEALEIEKLEKSLGESFGGMMRSWAQGTQEVSGLGEDWSKDPGKWKDRLIEIQSELEKKSRVHQVKLKPDFYLGLEDYRQKSPAPDEVPALAVHLSAAQRLVEKMFRARQVREEYPTPCEFQALIGPVRTGKVPEVGAAPPAARPGAVSGDPERKTFRVEFRCSPEVLYAYLRLMAEDPEDPCLFVVTDVVVRNEKSKFPLRSEIEKKFQNLERPEDSTRSSQRLAQEAKLLEILAGNEAMDVQMTVDFVAWKNPEESKAGSGAERKP